MSDDAMTPHAFWPVPLADFERPPVTETVLGVHFGPVRAIESAQIIELWQREFRDRFPHVEERDRHLPSIESFVPGATMTPRIEFRRGPQSPRYWFRSEAGDQLVQLQNDWMAFNWRKSAPEVGYHHFGEGAAQFEVMYRAFEALASATGARSMEPLQVEVTYINQIRAADGGWSNYDDLHKVLERAAHAVSGHLPPAESQTVALQYLAHDGEGKPFGRLYVTVESGLDETGPVFVLTLTFRARPLGADLAGVMAALDFGHHWIVGGFDELTTETMHAIWGRKERT